MSHYIRISDHSHSFFDGGGFDRVGAKCKQILNSLSGMASRAEGRRRFAALPLRQLEDIGLTIAERDDLLR
ncbi:MAG TPA: hypothetical protein VII20_14480 [Roseiarcus sp.]|jgi:hypothetical protein